MRLAGRRFISKRIAMNHDTKTPLQVLAEQRASAKIQGDVLQEVIRRAAVDYSKLGLHMQTLVDDFNRTEDAEPLGVSVEIQGPEMMPYDTFYLLLLKSSEATLAWKSLQIRVPNVLLDQFSNFSKVRIEVEKWSQNYKLDALKNGLSGYGSGHEPKSFGCRNYRIVQVGNTYGWLIRLVAR